jgi:anti-anti-sigma factor
VVVNVASRREVVLSGRLDVHTVPDVRGVLHAAIDAADGDLVIDLAAVELVDTTGLGVLLSAHRRATRSGGRVVLRGVTPPLQRLLRVTRLHRILALEPAALS